MGAVGSVLATLFRFGPRAEVAISDVSTPTVVADVDAGAAVLEFVGTTTANRTAYIAVQDGATWGVLNSTPYAVTLKTPNGTGVVIPAGDAALVACRATGLFLLGRSDAFGVLPADVYVPAGSPGSPALRVGLDDGTTYPTTEVTGRNLVVGNLADPVNTGLRFAAGCPPHAGRSATTIVGLGALSLPAGWWSARRLYFGGTASGAWSATVPSTYVVDGAEWVVSNQSGQSGTIKTAAGTGLVLATGSRKLVGIDMVGGVADVVLIG